jgi:hypothetical protein
MSLKSNFFFDYLPALGIDRSSVSFVIVDFFNFPISFPRKFLLLIMRVNCCCFSNIAISVR